MSSELTIDIQLTELGFSSWDFQVLKQKETHQTSDLEYASSSSSSSSTTAASSSLCPMKVGILVDEETDVGQMIPTGSRVNTSLDRAAPTGTSTGESTKRLRENKSGRLREKRRKCPWYDGNAEEQFKEDKKKKLHQDQRTKDKSRESGAQRKLMSDGSGEDEENEGEEDEGEDDDDDDDDDDDGDLMEEEEHADDLSSDTNGSEERRCHVCDLTFPSTFLLNEHLHIHNGVRLYRCAECGKQFCHLVNYRKHLRSHSQASNIQCVVCTAQFATREDLQQHLDTNHFEDQFYQCDLCKRIFTSMAECKKHIQTHKRRTRRYPCPKCEHSFRHRSSMLYHLKRHNKGVFLCTDCGLAFSTKAVLLRHSFHHLGLLPYTCIRCKRHFRLSSHYMKHECKPEQLQCVACLVIFQSQEDFLKHKKDTGCWGDQTALSTKANDIRCMECGQVFDSSEELKKHAGTHQRVLRCSECGMGFRSSIMLMSHMGGHAAQRPCLCKECGLGFCHQQAYDSHIKTCGLVNLPETATKKQKPHPKKQEAATTPKSKEIQTVMQATAVVSGQTQCAEGPTTFTANKEPLSPIPLVMLLPLPSTSASESVQNPPNPNSDVSKTCLSAPQVVHIPLPSANSSVAEKTDGTMLVKDMASPVPGSNILIPFTSVKNGKPGWTLLEGPCMSGSVAKIYALKKEDERAGGIKSKPIIFIPQINANNEKKSKVLSNLQILQVINMMKKNVCGDKTMENLSSLTTAASENADTIIFIPQINANNEKKSKVLSNLQILQVINMMKKNVCGDTRMENLSSLTTAASENAETKADDEMQTGSRLENSNPSPEESSDAKLTTNIASESLGEQMTEQYPEEEDLGLVGAMIELGDESDVVQCETCGKMILEKDLIQHSMIHSDSSIHSSWIL